MHSSNFHGRKYTIRTYFAEQYIRTSTCTCPWTYCIFHLLSLSFFSSFVHYRGITGQGKLSSRRLELLRWFMLAGRKPKENLIEYPTLPDRSSLILHFTKRNTSQLTRWLLSVLIRVYSLSTSKGGKRFPDSREKSQRLHGAKEWDVDSVLWKDFEENNDLLVLAWTC